MNLHHILPEQFGGTEKPDNLITLCDIHHKQMHIEFHAFYPDSRSVLVKMGRRTAMALSNIRRIFGVDDGYDLAPYLYFLTRQKTFRTGQLKVIRAALSGKSVLFVTPTGSGKSVTYQLPGLLGDRATLVVSPLKALMKDQVESIWSKKIPTTYINSDLTTSEMRKRYEFIRAGLYKFIFVAPERFDSRDPQTSYLYNQYSHFVIDEAHSIDMWGTAFRPSYRKLGEVREKLGAPPVIALTATASKETQDTILQSLNMRDAKVVVTGFKKDNIEIRIRKTDSTNLALSRKYEYIQSVITENPDQKIIIFTPTIERGSDLLKYLKQKSIDIDFYHSKLDTKVKMEIQNRFTGIQKPGLNILISTSAFGMGIDIPDIRHVIHLSPAQSVTDYVQQIGRAGRDGKQAYAHLLYDQSDRGLLDFMAQLPIKATGFKEKHNYTDEDISRVKAKLTQQVDDMIDLINQPQGTEWRYILEYFGEVPLNYWERNGRNVLNLLLISLFFALVYLLFLALFA